MTNGTTSKGNPNVATNGTGGIYSSKTWSGLDDPLYKKRFNPYSCQIYEQVRKGTRTTDINGVSSYNGNYVLMHYDPGYGSDYNDLLQKLATNIRGHQLNAAIALAELPEALRTVVNSLGAVRRLHNAVKHGDFPEVLRSLATLPGQVKASPRNLLVTRNRLKHSDAPGAWLSLQYSWLPVLADIYNLLKALDRGLFEAGGRNLTFSATKRRQEKMNVIRNLNYDVDAATHYSADVKNQINLSMKVILRENISASKRLGLNNPLAVLWEKVPFSFVWDWAQPIGQFLDNWGVLDEVALEYEFTAYRKNHVKSKMLVPYTYSWPYVNQLTVQGSFEAFAVYIDRTVGTSLPMQLPSFKSWDRVWGIRHIANAAALVWAVLLPGSNRGLSASGRGSWRVEKYAPSSLVPNPTYLDWSG